MCRDNRRVKNAPAKSSSTKVSTAREWPAAWSAGDVVPPPEGCLPIDAGADASALADVVALFVASVNDDDELWRLVGDVVAAVTPLPWLVDSGAELAAVADAAPPLACLVGVATTTQSIADAQDKTARDRLQVVEFVDDVRFGELGSALVVAYKEIAFKML